MRESQIRYREIVESSNDIMLGVQDGKLKFANTKVVELTGYVCEETLEIPFTDLFFPKDRTVVEGIYLRQLEEKEHSTTHSLRLLNKTSETCWVELNTKRTIWEGRPAVLAFLRDISERKQGENAPRESEQGYRTFVQSNPYGIQEFDTSGIITYTNSSYQKMLGYRKQKHVTMPGLLRPVGLYQKVPGCLPFLCMKMPL